MAAAKKELAAGAVRATAVGYYGGKLRDPGEVFQFEGGPKGSWFEPVEGDAPAPAATGLKHGSKPWIREKLMQRIAAMPPGEDLPEIPDTVAEMRELAEELGVDLQ